ncbi:MAG: PP2C family protein-serine/threonine phosphatase [Planctomycetes bacterium]|nr:PP2C family protein-serine/threonine phosphatase [Planctomycetota bacterium]
MLLLGNLMGLTTRNLVASQQVEQLNQRITTQLEQVAQLQRALLPQQLPRIPGLSMNAHYRPCEQAGGDYYDFIPLKGGAQPDDAINNDHPWGIMIADVSGHGASAAVIMAMVQTLAHAYPIDPEDPGRALEQINAHLIAERLDSSFVTAFLGVFHPDTRILTYASAGHHPPRIKHIGENNPARPLELASAPPLGIFDQNYHVETKQQLLNTEDTLILFTDGVTEAMSPTRELFGVERLDEAILCCSGEPDCIIGSLTAAVAQHEQGNRPVDDQTIVALKLISD